jgi:poly-gamma-glutamate synthesis protein (capsule biosynthesis protein)
VASILGPEAAISVFSDNDFELKENEVAVLRWDKVTANLKTLTYKGKLLWDKTDFDDYELKKEIEISDTVNPNYSDFNPDRLVKINFLGDIMLSRHVNTQMLKYGFDYPWLKTSEEISAADLTFANLEVPISDLRRSPSSGMSFIASTKNLVHLKDAGIDIVSVANNHSANFGYNVFLDNLKNLKGANLGVCGGGEDEDEARKPHIVEIAKTKFAFLCQSAIVGSLYAKSDTAGVPYLAIEPWYRDDELSIKALEEDIKKAKSLADVVIVSPHWGVEYKHKPNSSQVEVARRSVKAGADLVIGTHPHVVQSVEYYNNKYINYSLGNFIFDQEWSSATKQGVMVASYFYENRNIYNSLKPLQIENYAQPQFVTGGIYNEILKTISSSSIGF